MYKGKPVGILLAAFAVGAVTGLACDGGDGGPGGSSPEAKCRAFVRALCQRGATCFMESAAEARECETEGVAELRCEAARGTSATIDQCIGDIGKAMCVEGEGFRAPQTCVGVLDIPPTPAQQKCLDLSRALCTRIAECTMDATVDECTPVVAEELECSAVVAVGPTIDGCIAAVGTDTCPALFPGGMLTLPAACGSDSGGADGGAGSGAPPPGVGGSGGTLAPAPPRTRFHRLRATAFGERSRVDLRVRAVLPGGLLLAE